MFSIFQLSYFADVDLLLPRPNLGANTGSLVSLGSVGMVSNHLYRSGCWWTKVGDRLVTSWYVNVVVTEPCCEVTTGRSVSWYDSETHLQLVSPDLDYQTLVCSNRSNASLTLMAVFEYKTVTTKRKPLRL